MANVFLPDAIDTSIGNPIQSSWGTEVRAAIEAAAPAGEVSMYVGDVAPDGWLTMIGQTVTGFQLTYPVAWTRMPTAWKTGSSVKFPDTRARIPLGAAGYGDMVLGGVGGQNEAALTLGQMPAHSHGGATNSDNQSHEHGFSGSGSTNATGAHAHGFGPEPLIYQGTSFSGWTGSGLAYALPINHNGDSGYHDHTVSVSGATGGINRNHQHQVYSEGNGAVVSRMQAHFVITFMVRVY